MDDYLANLSQDDRQRRWERELAALGTNRCVFVAESDRGEVVGFASGGPERSGDPDYLSELYALYILPAYQRRGVGRELVCLVAATLAGHGFRSMLALVLEENPARRFYESLGGKLVRIQLMAIGGAPLNVVAYGWSDLSALIGRPE